MSKTVASKQRMSNGDRVFYAICYGAVFLLTLLVLYPVVFIVAASFSSPAALGRNEVWLWPVDFSTQGYETLFMYKAVWVGYRNTILYVVLGTAINLALTMLCAYGMSRKSLWGRNFISVLFAIPLVFSGGMIPSYLVAKGLGLIDTIWAMVIPGAMSIYNMIVARTFIQSNIPEELVDAAKIDGCDDFKIFFKIILPLSKAIIAVLTLWYAVDHWNAYFSAFLYLYDSNLMPLQIILRDILINSAFSGDIIDPEEAQNLMYMKLLLKYALIVVSTAPILTVYPFVQKYFVKGVMVGSVKG